MCSDPRNDRPAMDDYDDDRLHCGICSTVVTPANFAAWDAWDVFCVSCSSASEDDTASDVPFDSEYRSPMTCSHALRLAVEAALGAGNLLNGRDPHDDGLDLDEPLEETTEIEPESNAELVYGRRTEAA